MSAVQGADDTAVWNWAHRVSNAVARWPVSDAAHPDVMASPPLPSASLLTHDSLPASAVSRAFGDRLLKKYVVAEPDILEESLTGDDTLLIMATDGLWDVISNQDAISMVRVRFRTGYPAGWTASHRLPNMASVVCGAEILQPECCEQTRLPSSGFWPRESARPF